MSSCGLGPSLLGQLGAVGVEGDGGVHGGVGVDGELGVGGAGDDVGPLDHLGPVLDRHAEQFRDGKGGQDAGDLGDPVERATSDDIGQDIADGPPVAGLELGDGPGSEPAVDESPEPGVLGPVGLDDRPEQIALLLGLLTQEHPAPLGGEAVDVPVRRLHVGVPGEGPEAGDGRIVGLVPMDGRLPAQPRELVVRDAPRPLVGLDQVDVHSRHLSSGRGVWEVGRGARAVPACRGGVRARRRSGRSGRSLRAMPTDSTAPT